MGLFEDIASKLGLPQELPGGLKLNIPAPADVARDLGIPTVADIVGKIKSSAGRLGPFGK